MRRLPIVVLLSLPAALAAQSRPRPTPTPAAIAPGMSHAQVVAALGPPVAERTAGGFAYLFYRNDCGRRCGMNDLVVLRNDSVTDAIFRSARRTYAGASSSPAAIPPGAAAARKPPAAGAPTRLKVPPANDVRPSIPLDAPALRPASSSTPAKKNP